MKMVIYMTSLGEVSPPDLDRFFVGWGNHPSAEKHLELLQKSDFVVLAIDDETDRVIGFITAISDNVLSAYIPLLEVLPEYQGQGIGSELVKRMLEQLKDFYMIDLLCDADLQPFYEELGMEKATGMRIRNYEKQAGI